MLPQVTALVSSMYPCTYVNKSHIAFSSYCFFVVQVGARRDPNDGAKMTFITEFNTASRSSPPGHTTGI